MSEHMSEPARARAGRALSKTFLSGFRYEIGNRAFVLRTMKRILGRLVGDRRNLFWSSYYEFEKFNQPRYARAARLLGVDASIGWGRNFADGWSAARRNSCWGRCKPMSIRKPSPIWTS